MTNFVYRHLRQLFPVLNVIAMSNTRNSNEYTVCYVRHCVGWDGMLSRGSRWCCYPPTEHLHLVIAGSLAD